MPRITFTFSSSTFTGNQAIGQSNGEGDGGASSPRHRLNISNSSFTGNLAQGGTASRRLSRASAISERNFTGGLP